MVQSPTNHGFLPLHNTNPNANRPAARSSTGGRAAPDEHIVDIPLTPIMTNASTGARKEGHKMADYPRSDGGGGAGGADDKFQHKTIGRRRAATGTVGGGCAPPEDEGALTTMGKIYDKVLQFSVITRYALYILPLSLCFLVPILVSIYAAPHASIGGVRLLWFFVWVSRMSCPVYARLVDRCLTHGRTTTARNRMVLAVDLQTGCQSPAHRLPGPRWRHFCRRQEIQSRARGPGAAAVPRRMGRRQPVHLSSRA